MKYTIGEIVNNAYSLVCTKLFSPGARLIRRPVYIRGKKHMKHGVGFTTGYGCRFDLEGEGITLHIGDNCRFNDYVHITAYKEVTIGDNCLFASKIYISDTSHGDYNLTGQEHGPAVPPNDRELFFAPVKIGNNVWIGESVSVLKGVTIGDGCVIGASSVVTKSIPDGCIVVGNPARIIKKWNPDTEKWERVHE